VNCPPKPGVSRRVLHLARGRRSEFGTVESARRADLILLEANPLEEVGVIRDHLSVMVRGRWVPREALERMREEL
jgi:imidazolonepropionase-like amidohydrolase